MKRFPGRFLPLLLLAAAALPVHGAESVAELGTTDRPESWPLAQTAIEPSGKVRWGQLDNGLRYALMPHGSPAGRISLRLLVTVGSIHEREAERGYAHFVEHMAFNGTKNFPAGELLKFLQRMGATSQAHQNASTSHTRTLYKIELPENSASFLETGLGIFRDFADGILFQPAEVKRERGVILSEAQFREQPREVRRLALTELLYAGTRIAERQPIGLIPRIEQADARSLRGFYDAWYRPENMCVVVVGEIDVAAAEAKVRAAFTSLVARGEPGEISRIGTIRPLSEPPVLSEADEMGGFHLSLIKVVPRQPMPFTWGVQLEGRRLQTAFRMLARRLESLTHWSPRIISDSGASVEVEFDEFRQLTVKVSSSAQDWEKALRIAEQEVRRAIEHGFTPDELAYQQTILREQFRNAAASFATIASSDLADEITLSLEKRHPIFFVDEALEPALALIDQLTVDECQRSFREHWGNEPPRIFITTPAANIQPADVVRSAFAASQKIPVARPESVTASAFAYEDFGPAGEVTSKAHRSDLDIWFVRFANDVRLNINAHRSKAE